jgi:hypothetical protein
VLRGTVHTVWLAGIVAVITPVVLLLLAQTFVDGDSRTGLRGLIYLYAAGTLGGLVLELLQQKRYVLEKPCLIPRPAAEGDESVLREGPMWHLGFLSRMFIGGLAGAALVTLIGSVLGNLHVGSATEPGALVWAIVAGSAAPAVWKLLNDVMLKRGNAMDEVLAAIEQQAVRNATPPPTPPNGQTQPNGQTPAPATQKPQDDLAVSMARAMRHLV